MDGFWIVVWLVYTLASAFLAAGIADTKGRDRVMWFLAGLFFGVVGLIAAGLIENKPTEERNRQWVEEMRQVAAEKARSSI